MARPGIMLYFDMLDPIRVLPDADKGRLLVAMLEYGKDGVVPQFDGMLALAWGFVRPKLDRDEGSYENVKLQRKYAAFCKKRSGAGLPKIPFEEWLEMAEDERQRMVVPDNEPQRAVDFVNEPLTTVNDRYPTTMSKGTTKAKGTTMSKAAVATSEIEEAATAAQRELRKMGGELGKGVVLLSSVQIDDLLDRMGLDAFDHYVSRLANFIIKNDASVADHHGTILKWWRQDCGME